MLKDFLHENIFILDKVQSWEDAIQEAGKPLVEQGVIEQRYIQAMIQSVYKNGPYMIIMPKIALAHARPEDGVISNGISFCKLNTPVEFPENNMVDIIVVLAANENSSHLELMSELADLLVDDEKISIVRLAKDIDSIIEILFSE